MTGESAAEANISAFQKLLEINDDLERFKADRAAERARQASAKVLQAQLEQFRPGVGQHDAYIGNDRYHLPPDVTNTAAQQIIPISPTRYGCVGVFGPMALPALMDFRAAVGSLSTSKTASWMVDENGEAVLTPPGSRQIHYFVRGYMRHKALVWGPSENPRMPIIVPTHPDDEQPGPHLIERLVMYRFAAGQIYSALAAPDPEETMASAVALKQHIERQGKQIWRHDPAPTKAYEPEWDLYPRP